jgi:ferric-dicitrate binding protein FerR (iron transport regulator)
MSQDYEYIRQLTNESLTGIITPENKAILDKAIVEDPQALVMWQKTVTLYESTSMQQVLNSELILPEDISLGIIMSIERKQRNRRKIISAISIAASAVGIFILLFNPNHKQPPPKGVILQIAGEEAIALTDGQQQAGAVTLNSNAGTLSYKAKSTSSRLNKLTIPTGMTYQLVLADGSKVWLNSATTLEFPFTFNSATREIILNGEAYIEVAKDEVHPFFVRMPGNNIVQVLGTTFNVNTYDSGHSRVALVTGAVKVKTAAGKILQLKPGFEAITASNDLQTRSFDAESLLAWRQGEYYFTKATLEEVSKVITRWYGIQIVFDAPINKTFTGDLNRHRPLEEFLQGIHQLMDVEYYYMDGILHLK